MLVRKHVHAQPCEGWKERYKILTSENGRLLLLLGLLTGSLSLHGERSRLCSADPSNMPHPGQLLQPPHPSALMQTLPWVSWASLHKP